MFLIQTFRDGNIHMVNIVLLLFGDVFALAKALNQPQCFVRPVHITLEKQMHTYSKSKHVLSKSHCFKLSTLDQRNLTHLSLQQFQRYLGKICHICDQFSSVKGWNCQRAPQYHDANCRSCCIDTAIYYNVKYHKHYIYQCKIVTQSSLYDIISYKNIDAK